jgi:hypothetical protein
VEKIAALAADIARTDFMVMVSGVCRRRLWFGPAADSLLQTDTERRADLIMKQ